MATVTRRCGCRGDNGKVLGKKCPKLKDWRHGTWGYRISAGRDPESGKRRYLYEHGFKTSADAKEALAAAEQGLRRGTVDFTKTTVADYLRGWLDQNESVFKPSTMGNYKRYMLSDIIPTLGEKLLLKDLQRAHVAHLIRTLQADGRGAVTVRRIHAALSSALTDAVQDGMLHENVAQGARLPKVAKTEPEVWTPEQAEVFIDAANTHRLGPLFELAIFTGMRRGELLGLRWSDVELLKHRLILRTQLTTTSSGVQEGTAKTDAGQFRVVPLSERSVTVLMDWRMLQDSEREQWGDAYTDSGRVFTWEDGRALRPDYVSKLFRTISEGLDLPPMHLHSLRHFHISMMLASGQSFEVVSKMVGHKSTTTTREVYAHLLDQQALGAAEAMSSMLRPREGVNTSVNTSDSEGPSDASE